MANAKGQFPEHHPQFMGTYWGAVSSPFCAEVIESADAAVVAGPILNVRSANPPGERKTLRSLADRGGPIWQWCAEPCTQTLENVKTTSKVCE